jgi:hypothetical protein
MDKRFTKIGSFGVDSGTVMVVDPCYVLDGEGKYPLSFGHNWEEFVVMNLMDESGKVPYSPHTKQLHGEMGVVSSTGYGDGVYPVYARIAEGRVMEIRILFDGSEE